VDLCECSLATAEQHTKRPNTLGIFHHVRRDYFLEAPSHAVLLEWVTHIEHCLGVDQDKVSYARTHTHTHTHTYAQTPLVGLWYGRWGLCNDRGRFVLWGSEVVWMLSTRGLSYGWHAVV
jgi:hypothetical protein